MAPSFCVELSDDEQARLLAIAGQSIQSGLASENALQLDHAELGPSLLVKSAVFVTLRYNDALRGCVGSLQARASLAQAVATSSYNAAFQDRRFARIQVSEFNALRIEISVLSEMEPIEVDSRHALLARLQPGVDGLLLEDEGLRTTFLPKVWDKVDSPSEFLEQLLIKAGLASGYWSDSIRCYRYHTLNFDNN